MSPVAPACTGADKLWKQALLKWLWRTPVPALRSGHATAERQLLLPARAHVLGREDGRPCAWHVHVPGEGLRHSARNRTTALAARRRVAQFAQRVVRCRLRAHSRQRDSCCKVVHHGRIVWAHDGSATRAINSPGDVSWQLPFRAAACASPPLPSRRRRARQQRAHRHTHCIFMLLWMNFSYSPAGPDRGGATETVVLTPVARAMQNMAAIRRQRPRPVTFVLLTNLSESS
jgi:hypothetical protein